MKNARKTLLKALVSKKEIYTAMFLKLCAAEDLQMCCESFKVFYIYTNFLSKLRNAAMK